MSEDTRDEAAGGQARALVFEVAQPGGANHAFGLDVLRVEQVIEIDAVTPVPLAPKVVRGITSHHGRIVTVFDPALLMGLAPQPHDGGHAVVLEGDGRSSRMGMQVAHVRGILHTDALQRADIEAGPGVSWVARHEGRLIHIVEFSRLIAGLGRTFDVLGLEREGATI